MDKYIGKRLEGRYEIQELIGMGGMSNVYKAYDVIDDRTVAVKILRDEYLTNAEFLRRFKNESKAIAVLSHPNIVRVFDVCFTGKVHSIVMEYIDGITLKDYIERQGALEWKEAVHFTLEILKALQHAHDKGIVHRDIKPQNIMLLQSGTIKVTDFGIARFARSEVQTLTDRAIGSVHYISPEQAMGDQTDEKSDIYSVGVMLFEMLTGKLPFEADSPVSVALKQIQSQAVKPRSINPSIPEGLEDITIRAMQKDALMRYQSAAEMIADIEKFKKDPSIHFAYKYLSSESEGAQQKKYRRAISQSREEDVMQPRQKRTPYIPILTGVTFAFVLASLCFIGLMLYLNNPFKQVAEITLPNLVGLKFETAKNQYDNIEIIMDDTPVPNEQYGNGVVFAQDPKDGKTVKVGSPVRVRVSSGKLVINLQNFAGRDSHEVFAKLREDGLKYEEILTFSGEVAIGSVIYTDPNKDSQVGSGTLIKVYVSKGPEEVPATVPELIGLSLEDAKRLLEFSNLRVGNISYEEHADKPDDSVIGQDPPPGSQQMEGTPINVVVNKLAVTSTEQGSDKSLFIPIDLPVLDRQITIQAKQDGQVVAEDTFNPSELATSTWKPTFLGGSKQTSSVRIYIDNKLYIEYSLNFEMSTYSKVEDRSADFR